MCFLLDNLMYSKGENQFFLFSGKTKHLLPYGPMCDTKKLARCGYSVPKMKNLRPSASEVTSAFKLRCETNVKISFSYFVAKLSICGLMTLSATP